MEIKSFEELHDILSKKGFTDVSKNSIDGSECEYRELGGIMMEELRRELKEASEESQKITYLYINTVNEYEELEEKINRLEKDKEDLKEKIKVIKERKGQAERNYDKVSAKIISFIEGDL